MSAASTRLDLQPAFCDLESNLIDLSRLASVAETVGDDALRPADAHLLQRALGSDTYVPILMTKEQRDNLSFIIGHIADIAKRAMRKYDEAVERSLETAR